MPDMRSLDEHWDKVRKAIHISKLSDKRMTVAGTDATLYVGELYLGYTHLVTDHYIEQLKVDIRKEIEDDIRAEIFDWLYGPLRGHLYHLRHSVMRNQAAAFRGQTDIELLDPQFEALYPPTR